MSIDSVLGKRKIQEIGPDFQATVINDERNQMEAVEKPLSFDEIEMRAVFDCYHQILCTYFQKLEQASMIARYRKAITESAVTSADNKWNKALYTWDGTKETIHEVRSLLREASDILQKTKCQIDALPEIADFDLDPSNIEGPFKMSMTILPHIGSSRSNKFEIICNNYRNSFQKMEEIQHVRAHAHTFYSLAANIHDFDKYLEEQQNG